MPGVFFISFAVSGTPGMIVYMEARHGFWLMAAAFIPLLSRRTGLVVSWRVLFPGRAVRLLLSVYPFDLESSKKSTGYGFVVLWRQDSSRVAFLEQENAGERGDF
jgi:hypothetical protein